MVQTPETDPTSDIEKAAYFLWEEAGRLQGQEAADWDQASRLVAARAAAADVAPPPPPVAMTTSPPRPGVLRGFLERRWTVWRRKRASLRPPADTPPTEPPFGVSAWDDVLREERDMLRLGPDGQPAALCLSGGGIRSAAFCLGASKPLLERKLLMQFHYLSTVSGGGYVGAWLTRAIAEKGTLDPTSLDDALARLRRYTNYLVPTPGPASLDSWAAAVLWARNTLINAMLLLPLLFGVACIARFLLLLRSSLLVVPYSGWCLAAAGLACLCLAVSQAILLLPSHVVAAAGTVSARVRLRVVVPSLAWAMLASLAGFPLMRSEPLALGVLPLASVAAGLLAYGLAWAAVSRRTRGRDVDVESWVTAWAAHERTFRGNAVGWVVSCLCSGLLLWAGLLLSTGISEDWWIVLGPPWVMVAEALRSTVYVALRVEGLQTGLDREWLARLNGDKLRFALAYLVLSLATLAAPMLLLNSPLGVWGELVAIVGLLSTGPVAAVLGKSASTAFAILEPASPSTGKPPVPPLRLVLPALSLAFILTLLTLLGMLAAVVTAWLGGALAGLPVAAPALLATCLILAGCALLLGSAARVVKVNRFSMHAVYANRLVRAFLGTARRGDRRPDPYTDFDPADNARVSDMFDLTLPRPRRLFPVINVTLNATRSSDSARAERKAVPFTITPLHCGSRFLSREPGPAAVEPGGAYVPTAHYAGGDGRETGLQDQRRGLSLGTAMTISGAALSPNMGYYSSSLTAFVMTLFNLRLGAWLPNPGMQDASLDDRPRWMHRSSPHNALWPMLQELLGITRMTSRYVYLSDGGHFDNLGLYEMLRRRCARIVAIDVGQDQGYVYTDLGQALQHVLIDAGITVEFIRAIAIGAKELGEQGAYAEITYPAQGDRPPGKGRLLYLKPWLPAEAPTELRAFQALKQSFPHTSTADQFFSESDFESYRRLGEYLMADMLKATGAETGAVQLEALFDALASKARPVAG